MKSSTGKKLRFAACAGLALWLSMLSVDHGWAATAPIYKCVAKNQPVLYTDEPCKNGEPLNIRAGDADPGAVARLDRARDALDQSAARRIAENRRDAVLVERAAQSSNQPGEEGGSYGDGLAYGPAYGFVAHPFKHRHPMRHREPKSNHTHHSPPHVMPRL